MKLLPALFAAILIASPLAAEEKRPCEDHDLVIAGFQADVEKGELVTVIERRVNNINFIIIIAPDGSAGVIPEKPGGSYCEGFLMRWDQIGEFLSKYRPGAPNA